MHADLNYKDITLAELGFEVLCATETFKLAVDHDGQLRAQRFALLHAAYTGVYDDDDDDDDDGNDDDFVAQHQV